MAEKIDKCILVSYASSVTDDAPILIVGEKKKQGDVAILNAIQGPEATELFEKLTVPKGVRK